MCVISPNVIGWAAARVSQSESAFVAAIDLIRRLLRVDMNSRLSVLQAYTHKWIKEVCVRARVCACVRSSAHLSVCVCVAFCLCVCHCPCLCHCLSVCSEPWAVHPDVGGGGS